MDQLKAVKKVVNHTVLFLKEGRIGGIFLQIDEEVNTVTSFDSRLFFDGEPYYCRSFVDPRKAIDAFRESVSVSQHRGWVVVYNGRPNFG